MKTCFAGRIGLDRKSIFISAPAKINLFLKVLRQRPDGYHDIYSWFQALDLADHLEIISGQGSQITINTDHPDIPSGEENLVYRAIRSLQEKFDINTGFEIKLWKNIPVAAGLGGGSSDAAAAIKGINKLLALGLSRPKMEEIGARIGSDVPFFFSRGQAEVTGRGEKVRNLELPTDYEIILVTPPFGIPAAEAYRKVRLDLTAPHSNISLSCCRKASKLFGVISDAANDLERASLGCYPILERILYELAKTGADIVRLSGSGPTVFALYLDKGLEKKKLAQSFEREGWRCQVARPIILPADD